MALAKFTHIAAVPSCQQEPPSHRQIRTNHSADRPDRCVLADDRRGVVSRAERRGCARRGDQRRSRSVRLNARPLVSRAPLAQRARGNGHGADRRML
jgi:hypothetical protein